MRGGRRRRDARAAGSLTSTTASESELYPVGGRRLPLTATLDAPSARAWTRDAARDARRGHSRPPPPASRINPATYAKLPLTATPDAPSMYVEDDAPATLGAAGVLVHHLQQSPENSNPHVRVAAADGGRSPQPCTRT